MPIGYMGYSLGRMADSRSRQADAENQPAIEPLKPGEDPLSALDPETRELVLSTEPVVDPEAADGTTFGDRVQGMLVGAGLGAFAGAMLANWTPRSRRYYGAAEMNVRATLAFAGIGAVIGGIAGFARGHDPVEKSPRDQVQPLLAATNGAAAASGPIPMSGEAQAAFASLHGQAGSPASA
jgi:hypothetical protein